MLKNISNRTDVYTLIDVFYKNIRSDDVLGSIFNNRIQDSDWPAHINKLTDFWFTNLFGVPMYKGNPTQKHMALDKDQKINESHFSRWLLIWENTVGTLYKGDKATRAIDSAKKIAVFQLKAIEHAR